MTILKTEQAVITVATDNDLSSAVDLKDFTLSGLIVPAGLSSTTLNFWVSVDGVNFYQLVDAQNSTVTVDVGATAKAMIISPCCFAGWQYIKIGTGSAEGSNKTFTLVGVLAANRQ